MKTSCEYISFERSASDYTVFTSLGRITARGVVFAPGAHETTAGSPLWPISASQVANGACVIHSSGLSQNFEAFYSARKKYVVGASKAAIDILETLNVADTGVVWAHRGHVIFHNREGVHAAMTLGRPMPPDFVTTNNLGNMFLKQQHFKAPFEAMLKRGAAVCVGQPVAEHPALRGGVESEKSMMYARNFLSRQVIISSIRCHDGVLQLCRKDGRNTDADPNAAVVKLACALTRSFTPSDE